MSPIVTWWIGLAAFSRSNCASAASQPWSYRPVTLVALGLLGPVPQRLRLLASGTRWISLSGSRLTSPAADGSSREFYRIGLSANTTGISVYVLGLDDKTYLARTYGASLGKASVTGYCIKFKRLSVINAAALQGAIRHGMNADQTG